MEATCKNRNCTQSKVYSYNKAPFISHFVALSLVSVGISWRFPDVYHDGAVGVYRANVVSFGDHPLSLVIPWLFFPGVIWRCPPHHWIIGLFQMLDTKLTFNYMRGCWHWSFEIQFCIYTSISIETCRLRMSCLLPCRCLASPLLCSLADAFLSAINSHSL